MDVHGHLTKKKMNKPEYKIHGLYRRKLKKKLSKLKYFVKIFWFHQDLERVYGGGLSDKECDMLLHETQKEIETIENKLNEKID